MAYRRSEEGMPAESGGERSQRTGEDMRGSGSDEDVRGVGDEGDEEFEETEDLDEEEDEGSV